MKRITVILLALLFCFLAYLEATAQEVAADTQASISIENRAEIAESDISQVIDSALEIICADENGKMKIDHKKNTLDCEELKFVSN